MLDCTRPFVILCCLFVAVTRNKTNISPRRESLHFRAFLNLRSKTPYMMFSPASPGNFRQTISKKRRCISILRAFRRKYDGYLPRSLAHSGDLALMCQFAEAYTANAVVTQISVGAAADFAAVVLSCGEFCRKSLLDFH